MPDKPQLRISVLTLAPGDEAQLVDSPLSTQLKGLIAAGSLKYTAAADDWEPFGDGKTIWSHLQEGLNAFDVFSESAGIRTFKTRRNIGLFVVDPAALLHPVKSRLAILIQEHVCSRDDKASCIVIHGPLPPQFFRELQTYYSEALIDLLQESKGKLFEDEIDSPRRLRQFLRRLGPELANVPHSERDAEALTALRAVNGRLIPPISPTIGMGAG